SEVAAVYDIDVRVAAEVEKNIVNTFEKAAEMAGAADMPMAARIEELRRASGLAFPPQYAEAVLRSGPGKISETGAAALSAAHKILDSGVHADSYSVSLSQVDFELSQHLLSEEHRVFASVVLKVFIRPNRFVNEDETAARRKRAADSVQPVKVFKDDVVVKQGEIITRDHLRLLQEGGIVGGSRGARPVLSSVILAFLIVATIWVYVRQFRPGIYSSEAKVMQMALILSGTIAVSRFLSGISEYLAPVPAGTMLLATLLDPGTAILGGVCMSVATGVAAGNNAPFMVVSILSSIAAVYGISRVGHRADLVRAGVLVGLVCGLGIVSMALIMGSPFNTASRDVFYGALNGSVISSFLALGALPFFEAIFNIMTPVKLLDLSNPNHPLLGRLLKETPGTYHHSIMVANLAEAAAEAVGANSLLARVGGYYHDIGKIRRPYFFIENQLGVAENPHDRVAPGLSTLIVTSHVKDGAELGREYRLPERIIDFIKEHHGTTLVSYFYSRAAEDEKSGCQVVEEDFRYEGPRPSSKETAIVMLADAVEAAVRSLVKPSPGRIETIIRRIVKDRLYDHQLDKCDLTVRDLDTISDTFMKVLSGMFHPRIGYPHTGGPAANAGAPGGAPGERNGTNGDTGGSASGESSGEPDAGAAGEPGKGGCKSDSPVGGQGE
ncbi:MAG: HD family phosphohydrolase, partial [Bacillota bacterium]